MLKPGDIIRFKDPLRGWKYVTAEVTANLGPGPSGGRDDRIFVRNPGGVSQVWPAMKIELVAKSPKVCPTCGRKE